MAKAEDSVKQETGETSAEVSAAVEEAETKAIRPYGKSIPQAEDFIWVDGVFNSFDNTLEAVDSLLDGPLVVEPDRSAKILEDYFGQYYSGSVGERVEHFIEDLAEDAKDLDDPLVLDVETFYCDGLQYIRYTEGEVSEIFLEELEAKSEGYEFSLKYDGRREKVFIRSEKSEE